MAKLYKMEGFYKKEIERRKNKNKSMTKKEKIAIISKNKKDMKNNINKKKEEIKKINDNNTEMIKNEKNEQQNDIIKITREEYDKKLDALIKQTRIYINELEKLPIANKSNKVYEREIQLNKYIDEIQQQIKKYQLYEGIEIIE